MDKNELKEKIERLELKYNNTIMLYDKAVMNGANDDLVNELFDEAISIHRELAGLYEKLYPLEGSDGKD